MLGFINDPTPFTEGMLGDAINSAGKDMADLSRDKAEFDNADNAAGKVAALDKIVNDDVLTKAGDRIGKLDDKLKAASRDGRSIIARSRNSVMQFPVYCSRTIRAQEATIIAKAFERVYASLVQTILAQNPIVAENEVNDLKFLRRFHTNIMESTELSMINEFYTPIDEFDEMMTESVYYTEKLTPTMEVSFRAIPCTDEYLIKESARLSNVPLSGFAYLEDADAMRDKTSETAVKRVVVTDADLKKIANDMEVSVDDVKKDIIRGAYSGYEYNKTEKRFYRVADKTSKSTLRSVNAVDAPRMLRDTDIKKINGMLPYTIEASFRIKGDSSVYGVKYIIGVKTNFHPIEANDLASDLREILSGKMKNLQKVRYKTGEISLADYLFDIKNIKRDATKSINYNKKWLNTLKRLGEWEATNKTILGETAKLVSKGSVPIPNGTMILSANDVGNILGTTGINLEHVPTVKRLSRALFLIAVCIVDGAAGTMKVLFPDSDDEWDIQSLASIDADVAKSDNSALMKELNRAINH